MNKLSILLILCTFIISANASEKEDQPSIGDIIGEILGGDNDYKSYNVIAENEKSVCIDKTKHLLEKPVDKNSFYQAWNINCTIINHSELCEKVKKEDKLICDKPPKQKWHSNVWEKTKSCGAGIKKSWEEYYKFIKSIGQYVLNSEVEVKKGKDKGQKKKVRDDVNSKVAKGYNAMKAYLSTETTKHQDKYNVPRATAFLSVTKKLLSKFTDGLTKLIAASAPKVGCYNYKAKTRVTCQVLAEFFVQPLLLFKFIKTGPKILKGTRIAKFFEFHGANAKRKVASTAAKITPAKDYNIDFIGTDTLAAVKILENPTLLKNVSENKEIFKDIFPDAKDLDELSTYLSVKPTEGDYLANIIKELARDKDKLTPEQYADFIQDIKAALKNRCSI